jgi:hypothetical protein
MAEELGWVPDGVEYLQIGEADALVTTGRGLDRSGFPMSVNGPSVTWGAITCTRSAGRESESDEELKSWVRQLAATVADWPDVTERRQLSERWNEFRSPLADELDAIVLRQVLPGVCPYCPGSVERVRRSRP